MAQASAERVDNFGMVEKRATDRPDTLAIDALTGGLRMGAKAHPVADPTDPEQVYGAYLSLLYAVRGARRGEEIPLRSTDLDALLTIVGEDVELIERRLIELMGCSAEEATLLRRVLVRHRNLAASVGAVAGLSLVALLGPSVASATGTPTAPAPSASVVVPADPSELPPLTSYATTDDGQHVPVPESWSQQDEQASPPADETVTAASTSSKLSAPVIEPVPARASAPPSHLPSAAPAPSATAANPASSAEPAQVPEAARIDEVVLGEPMAPVDRPGWSPEDEVVLGEPMKPVDRPGWSPEDEVVLGEPMKPIDRPGWSPEDEVVLGEPMTPIDRPQSGGESAAT